MRTNLIVTFLLINLCLFHSSIYSQSEIEEFTPGSKSIGYGGSLVVQVRDPTAIFWNPAALTGLKDREILLNINQPFRFNFISLTQFFPLYGTLGIAFSRIPTSEESVDRASFAWGYEVVKGFSIGSSFNIEKIQDEWFWSTGMSFFVGNAKLGTLDQRGKEASPLKSLDKLNFGVTIQNIPLSEKLFEPSALLGFSYRFPSVGLLFNSGYHIVKGDNTNHLGVGLEISHSFSIYSGVEDLDFDTWGIGISYLHDNFMFDLTYSKELARLLFTLSARISPNPKLLAAPYYERGAKYVRSRNYKSAIHEFKKYLAYDVHGARADTVLQAVKALEKGLAKTQFMVDSLLTQAEKLLALGETQNLRAALILTKILELEPEHMKARQKLAILNPMIDNFINKSQLEGFQKYDSKKYIEAKDIFRRILLFKKNDEVALHYISEIDSILIELGEEYYFRGVGYFKQKSYKLAQKQFLQALRYNPDLEKARRYLKLTNEKFEEYKNQINKLLLAGQSFEKRKKYVNATKKYLQVLKLDNDNEVAKKRIAKLRPNIEIFLENKYKEAIRFFREERFNEAEEAFSTVLSIEPDHKGARRNLKKLQKERNEKAMEYYTQGENYFQIQNWQYALDFYIKALRLNPQNAKIVKRKKETEKNIQIVNLQEEGRNNFKAQKFIEASEIFKKILQLNPNNELAKKKLAECNNKIQELVKKYFDEGINLYTLEKYEDAIKMWDEALKLNPNHNRSAMYKKQALKRLKALKALKLNE